ncbi:dockerin type I domain-containing protein [Pseudobacteroides cellulosolvens]|uniref:Proteinase inhibitor I42, chagasin n=1 Tax=Pseudobacteroides cellulosolvens ATCC 35603 = DSM 2933 TaxID=398512 RepID=A0A0L6JVD6_9FIRM|nr:dockerin type I domain-containing protein [Pseudobacteroides cellulosolvens]KNY29689.1 Proteinase inhibitor I42, chagasin [Pseudobacteroides cellulosolvens ATCC 35603 = DSM 2933]
MRKNFCLPKLFVVLALILVFSVLGGANSFAVLPAETIGEDEFLFIHTHTYTEGIGDVGEYKVIDSPTYFYWADQRKLTSYDEVPGYNAKIKVIVGSERRIAGTAGIGSASELAVYDTLTVKDKFSIDYDLSVNFYMNNEWRKVKLGDTWTQTVESAPETGNGKIRTTYTITNFGIHKKSDIIAPGITTPTPQPTPTPKPSPKNYSISGYLSSESLQLAQDCHDNFKIEIQGLGLSALTDKSGYFKIDSIPETSSPGSLYLVTISKAGYLKRSLLTQLSENIEIGSPLQPIPMIPGDINTDSVINMSDIVLLAKSFNTIPSDVGFNSAADFNYDKVINMGDVVIIAKNFNATSADYVNPTITGINNIKLYKDDYTAIILREGQGLTWDYSISNENVIKFQLKQTGTLQYSEGLPGSTWSFKAINEGTATITFTSSAGKVQKYNITVTDDKYDITVKKDETFDIPLREGGIASTKWDYVIGDENIVKLESKNVIYRGIDFADIKWTFKGISKGTTSITFTTNRGDTITFPITVT